MRILWILNMFAICLLFMTREKSLINFVKNYKKFRSGKKHKLIICFKQIKLTQLSTIEKN